VVICVERSTDLHMAQLMPLPLTVSCFSKIQIGFTFLVPAHQQRQSTEGNTRPLKWSVIFKKSSRVLSLQMFDVRVS